MSAAALASAVLTILSVLLGTKYRAGKAKAKQLAEELFKNENEYISKVAKTEVDICSLVEAGFEYVCEFNGHKIFRKKKY